MNEKRVTKNSIPDEKAIERAILDALKSGRQKSEASLEKDTAAILGLSVAERTYRIGASKTTLYGNRFKKARAELHEAGLIEYPAKAKVRLTGDGKTLAQEHALGASQPKHAEDARRKAAEPAADGLYRFPKRPQRAQPIRTTPRRKPDRASPLSTCPSEAKPHIARFRYCLSL